jgi:carboxypeptidase D
LEKIPVLLFAGDQDFICNYMGIESMIKSLTWNGETGLGVSISYVRVAKLTVFLESTNKIMDRQWLSGRNLGVLAKPHVCQGASCSLAQVALLTTSQIFNASHMVPYDVPDIAHDMILRFMGMNFSAIVDGSARIPSTVGDDAKPIFLDSGDIPLSSPSPGNTPEQSKAQWDGEPSLWYDN